MSGRRTKTLRILGVLAALQGAAAFAYFGIERERAKHAAGDAFELQPEPAGLAPMLDLQTYDGHRLHLRDLRGRVVLLHFWATWCAPCVRELPELLALADDLEDDGVLLLAVSLDDSWKNVETFFGGRVPKQIVRGAAGDEARRCSVGPLPETLLLRPGGETAFRVKGARTWSSPGARRVLLGLR